MKIYMKLVDKDFITSINTRFTLNRIYVIEKPSHRDDARLILNDDNGKGHRLNENRFIPATEEEFHAQRGIRQVEKFNL